MVGQRKGMRSRHRDPSCGLLGDSSLKTSEIIIPTWPPGWLLLGLRAKTTEVQSVTCRPRDPYRGDPGPGIEMLRHIRLIIGPRESVHDASMTQATKGTHGSHWGVVHVPSTSRTRPRGGDCGVGRVDGQGERRSGGVGGPETEQHPVAGILVSDRGERMLNVSMWTVSSRSELCMSVGIITH